MQAAHFRRIARSTIRLRTHRREASVGLITRDARVRGFRIQARRESTVGCVVNQDVAGATRRGHHVKHFTTAAPQFSATIALNPGWGSRDPSALAEQIAEFRDLIRLIFDASI